MQFSVDLAQFRRDVETIDQRQMPFAVATALNDTAKEVLEHLQNRMEVVFDRPTRFTKNSLQVWRATKTKLEAAVQERPSVGKRHYLKMQETGGARPQTGLEKAFGNLAYEGLVRSVIPATGSPFEAARLDAFGNWSSGERNQVLSALKIQRDPNMNATAKSAKRNRKRATYFVPKHGLAPGVYRRNRPGDIPVRVLKFSDKAPVYPKRFGFYDGAEQIFSQRIGANLAKAIEHALATAR